MIKKSFFLLIALTGLLVSCSPESAESPSGGNSSSAVTGEDIHLNFSSDAGSTMVRLSAKKKWSAKFVNESAKDWCSVSPENGDKGTAALTVAVKENQDYDERSASIIFSYGNFKQTIYVTQKQKDAILVTSNNITLDAAPGEFSVEVRSNINVSFTIPSGCNWIHEDKTKALSSSTFHFSYDENESFQPRNCKLVFKSDESNVQEELNVTQLPASGQLILTTGDQAFGPEGGSFDVVLKSNMDLQVLIGPDGCDWIQPFGTKALTERTHSFSVGRNQGRKDRSGWVVFRNEELACADTVFVSQEFQPILASAETQIASGHGWTIRFDTVGSDPKDYRVEPAESWLSLVGQEKLATGIRFFAYVQPNEGTEERNGKILVYLNGYSEPDTVHVRQFGPLPCFSFTTTARSVKVPEVAQEDQAGFVFWGDDTMETYQYGLTHTYESSAMHTVTVEIQNKKHVMIDRLENGMTINLKGLRNQ